MTRSYRFRLGLVLLGALVFAGVAAPARATWVAQTSDTGVQLRGVNFPVDATTGYAVGASGTILKTTDGGATWGPQDSGTNNTLWRVHFPVNVNEGYVVGALGTILKTTDGGANWDLKTSGTLEDLRGVHFPNATVGYAVGDDGTILKTIDGGETWGDQTLGTNSNNLWRVHFPANADEGYAVGALGTILTTTDGGATDWVAQDSGTTEGLTGVHFPVNATVGYAVGNLGVILTTTDSGATWDPVLPAPTAENLRAVHFPVDATTGYAVGGTGTILKTIDSGASWAVQASGTVNGLRDVHFPVDANTGYTVGVGGTILLGFYFEPDGDSSEWGDGHGNEWCVEDEGGANDWNNPATADITEYCVASDQSDNVFVLFRFDDWELNGANKATGCVVIDTTDPEDMKIDYVICATLTGPGDTTVEHIELYSCDNSSTSGCGNANLDKTFGAGEYGFSNTEAGPFDARDSLLEVKIAYTDLGVTGSDVLFSSLISYEGRSLLNSPKDSIFGTGGSQNHAKRIEYDLDTGTASTTPVTLAYFRSDGRGSVTIEWGTATETANLGFHLYALSEKGLDRLNDSLIPRAGDTLTPQRYRFEAWGVDSDQFVLEDVDHFGHQRRHGPFELGRSYGAEVRELMRTDWVGIRREHERKAAARRPGGRSDLGRGPVSGPTPSPGNAPAVRLRVREEGIYRLTHEALLAAGVDLGGVPAAELALLEGGQPVPIRVGGYGVFGAGSFVEFVGRGLDTLYTDTNVYTLLVAPRYAERIGRGGGPMLRSRDTPEFFYETRTVETNRIYSAAAPNDDPWFDTEMVAISGPIEALFELALDDRLPEAGPVELEVEMWGVTDFPEEPDHHVVVEVNGVELADEWFEGLVEKRVAVEIPDWVLEPQDNVLRLRLPHDTGALYDVVYYEHYQVRFPRPFEAVDGRLRFTAAAEAFRVDGLPSADVVVYRVSEDTVERIEGVRIIGFPGDYSATFAGGREPATYFVSAVAALRVPPAEPASRPTLDMRDEAELLVIAHPDFLDGLEPLVSARRSEGLSVQVVNVEELYDRFSYGVFDPQAIRTFVRRAYRELGTEYVLLVGGDTYDYFDHLGLGSISFVPTLYARTGRIVHFAPVDPLYGDIDDDGVPDVAVGRWPVRTTAELEAVLEKTLEYADIDYARTAVLSADAHDTFADYSFSLASEEMLGYLPGSWQAERVYLDDMDLGDARRKLVDEINNGVALTSYFGHSAPALWSFQRLFDSRDADALENFGRPTVVTQWGCWNTYYVLPTYNTLGHRLLLGEGRGAAAVLGAATLTEAQAEEELGRRLFAEIGSERQRLGQALLAAKRDLAATDPDRLDVLLGWTLLGDPTLVVEP